VLGGFIAVYLLLFAQNAAMTLPSLTAQFSKPSVNLHNRGKRM
jgi:hypothetical protein